MSDCHVHGSNCGLVCPVHRIVVPENSPGVRWIPGRESILRIPYCPEYHPAGDGMMMPLCVLDAQEARATLHAHEETIGRLSRVIQDVLDDEESRPGGWGPDVTMVAVLRDALAAAPPGEYEQRVRASALEEAAELCDGWSEDAQSDCEEIAAAIRALVSKE